MITPPLLNYKIVLWTNFLKTLKFNAKNPRKKTLSEGSVRSKYSSKSSNSSSSSSNTSMKSNKSLFKLRQDTEKVKIFVDQIEEQAKRKLELIKGRQELEEAETLNAVAEAKEPDAEHISGRHSQ